MIDSLEAQRAISRHRTNAIVVTAYTSSYEWPQVTTNPDLDLSTSLAMSHASSIGLGLALAQPAKRVIVLDADGSLLMNLGSLVTIANMAPTNLVHFVFQNNVYRTSGGQPIPNAANINFAEIARGAGYANSYHFDDLNDLERNVKAILSQAGPTFVCLKVPPATERPPFKTVHITDMSPRFPAAVQSP